eukprot:Nk52_evm26s1671 gene=Nk52_evmTU26s1671
MMNNLNYPMHSHQQAYDHGLRYNHMSIDSSHNQHFTNTSAPPSHPQCGSRAISSASNSTVNTPEMKLKKAKAVAPRERLKTPTLKKTASDLKIQKLLTTIESLDEKLNVLTESVTSLGEQVSEMKETLIDQTKDNGLVSLFRFLENQQIVTFTKANETKVRAICNTSRRRTVKQKSKLATGAAVRKRISQAGNTRQSLAERKKSMESVGEMEVEDGENEQEGEEEEEEGEEEGQEPDKVNEEEREEEVTEKPFCMSRCTTIAALWQEWFHGIGGNISIVEQNKQGSEWRKPQRKYYQRRKRVIEFVTVLACTLYGVEEEPEAVVSEQFLECVDLWRNEIGTGSKPVSLHKLGSDVIKSKDDFDSRLNEAVEFVKETIVTNEFDKPITT